MRVIMTGGGTGGHIYPAISIADEIKKRHEDADILFVGAERGLEKTIVPDNGYPIELIPVHGLNRKKPLKNIKLIKEMGKSGKRSKEIIEAFDPDVVIGTGGYASAAMVKTAQKMDIPTYIHEQNAFPGMTNRMLEKHVRKVFLGFEDASGYFKHPEKQVVSGNPVRRDFLSTDRKTAREKIGFSEDDFVLLAFGGSQGAGRINRAMIGVIEAFRGTEGMKICLGTGSFYYEAMLDEFKTRGIEPDDDIQVREYINDMNLYLAAADLVISRSGAITVAEVTSCGIPAIFIPSPMATGNHQYFNAKAVAERGGAMVIEEKDLSDDGLVSVIKRMRKEPDILKDMAGKSLLAAPKDAAGAICDNIEELS